MTRVTLSIQKIAGLSGGAEKVLVDLANQLASRGHSVDILSYEDTGGAPFYPLKPGVISLNIKPYDERRQSRAWRNSVQEASIERAVERVLAVIDRTPFASRILWKLRYGRMIERMRQFIEWHKPEVIISFMPASFTYVVAARHKATHKPAIIISNHNLPEADYRSLDRWDRNRHDRRLRRRSVRQVEAVTVLLPEYREWFSKAEQANIHVIGNAIVPLDITPDETKRENYFISIGRLTKTKNHEVLIRAFATISARIPGWSVRIFGEGPLHGELKSLIEELDLSDSVHLMGRSEKIAEELARSKVMVFPSLHEGFPLVVGESFAAGVPVIGFADCSGVNRLVRDGKNGLLVGRSSDPVEAIAVAMEDLVRNENRRRSLSEGAIADARSGDFTTEGVFGAWDALVRAVAPASSKRHGGAT